MKQNNLQNLWKTSALADGNAEYLEQLYDAYLQNKNNVSEQWRNYFDTLLQNGSFSASIMPDISHKEIREQFRHLEQFAKQTKNRLQQNSTDEKQVKVLQLINAYRFRGHQWANINPFGQINRVDIPELTLEFYQLSRSDFNTVFNTGSLVGSDTATLSEILTILESTYLSCIGAEYMHITNTNEKRWIQNYLEGRQGKPPFSKEIKHKLLKELIAAEGLEQHLHVKYIGQKRFSLEGGESLIPMLKGLILRAGGKHKVKEIVLAMAHRGRLNVLVNIMGKKPEELFMEFEDKNNNAGTGDVKYHMGFSSNYITSDNPIHLALAFNPSHLEIIGPVVEGSVRARQDHIKDKEGKKVIPILIHGDAAFAGQGINMETFNMSQSRGYSTKGTIHIVINNQIGFTTSNQEDARSTLYCTDVAKMVNAPIFHVNGDDPESVLLITQLALDYRMKFSKDVVIDMVCYRRHGHSEADEPMATQPTMYKNIKKMQTTKQIYADKLLKEKMVLQSEVEEFSHEFRQALESGNSSVVPELIELGKKKHSFMESWNNYKGNNYLLPVETKLNKNILVDLYKQLEVLPEGFELHPTVKKILASRNEMIKSALPIDWGFAETMAYASLLKDGFNIRLSGQDSGRGTFFHRHAVLYNQKDNTVHVPLRNINEVDSNFLVINSLLSEAAVLAFEYGYATTDPQTLTIWEAQFGDFANNAQVVIDQFISAGEQKWQRLSGLVMFLPHGFEGQGPEHSSARLERYLQLCAQHNMQVCMPTNAAQIFHLLRRQMLMKSRRPLIVMTPKSLLRHPVSASELSDLTDGSFKMIIPEVDDIVDEKVKRVILCSGKVYYDLVNKRREDKREDVAIIRIEQLYPFPDELTREQTNRYSNAETFIWCQEEPMNQGAWYSTQHHMRRAIGKKNHYLEYAGRPLLAAPAVGSMSLHKKQLQDLLNEALG